MSRHVRVFCALFPVMYGFAQVPGEPVPTDQGISVRVLQGDGAINSIRLRRAHDPVVQVVASAGEPVANATVTFLLPATGPGGEFAASGSSLTMQTDAKGVAASHGLRPNRLAGKFRIRVTASWRGESAAAFVTQTNAEPVAASHRSRTIAILAALGGGAAVAAAVAAGHGGGSSSSPPGGTAGTGTVVTISPGSPTLGPPK